MSYTIRGRRVCYDNVAAGTSNTTKERPTLGGTNPSWAGELQGGGSRIRSGADGSTSPQESSTEPTANARERIITSAGGVTTLWPAENPENPN